MEGKRSNEITESYPMNGGEGPHSYLQNSNYQRGVIEASNKICLADLGCSTGPNTLIAVQNILEAMQLKYLAQNYTNPKTFTEFQVFFNDNISNDFNTLFKSLPSNKNYFAVGVPGSFHGRLFPKASLHFIHCSYALHWLSKVPSEVMDKTCLAWNKGRIHYTNAPYQVEEAYANQHAKDMESFLEARAQELVVGGLLAFLIPAVPDILLPSDSTNGSEKDLLGSCLMDMANVELVSEAEVDCFNVPMYNSSPNQLKAIIQRNEHFCIEKMKKIDNPKKHLLLPNLQLRVLYLRAALEGLLEKHFGFGIMDELFNCFAQKIAASSFFLNPKNQKSIVMSVLLKRKPSQLLDILSINEKKMNN